MPKLCDKYYFLRSVSKLFMLETYKPLSKELLNPSILCAGTSEIFRESDRYLSRKKKYLKLVLRFFLD